MNRIRVAIEVLTSGARKSLQEFKKDFAEAEGVTGKLRAGWSGLGQMARQNAVAVAGAGAVVVGAAYKMAQGAAETNAAFASLNQIAGETIANDVAKWAEDGVRAFGLSDRAIFTYSKSLANVADSVGQSEAEMRSFVQTHLRMAADFAAFADTSPDQVMQDLMSAYAGSSEVLQKYGVFANETNLKQLLLAETGEKVTGTLTSQQRVMAINLALKQKHLSIDGQWERESDSLAGQQARLASTLTNIQDRIGTAVLPAFESLFGLVNDNADAIEDFADSVGAAVKDISDAANALGQLKQEYDALPAPIKWTVERMHEMRGPLGFLRVGVDQLRTGVEGLTGGFKQNADAADGLDRAARGRAAPGLKRLRDELEAATTAARRHEEAMQLESRVLESNTRRRRDAIDVAQEQADALDELAAAQGRLLGGEFGVRDAQRRATDALREYEEAAANGARSAERLLNLQQQVVNAERGAEAADRAVEDAKRAAAEADRAVSDAKQRDADQAEIGALQEQARIAREGVYSAENRARDADGQIDQARRRVEEEERKASPEELAELRDRATEAQLRAAQAAADYAADLRIANGETLTNIDRQGLLRDALGDVAMTLAPSSPLRANLAGYVTELDGMIATAEAAIEKVRLAQLAAAEAVRDEMVQRGYGGFANRGNTPTTSPQAPVVNNHTTIQYLTPRAGAAEVDNARRDWEMRNGPGR